jgi:hypothetical protein
MNLTEFKLLDLEAQIKRSVSPELQLFDPVRKKWVMENPEEIVRQCLILWLTENNAIPYSRMAIEKQIQILGLTKRYDLVVYNKSAMPYILVECKAPHLAIHQSMFDQAAVYNMKLQAPFLGICNGHELKLCEIDFDKRLYHFIAELPHYPF